MRPIKTFMEENKHTNTVSERRSALLQQASCGLCPPGSLWMSKQRVLPSVPCVCACVCAVLWSQPGGLYNMSLLDIFLLTFHIFYIYRTGNLWHMTGSVAGLQLPLKDSCPHILSSFCAQFVHLLGERECYSGDDCLSSPALRSWTGLTTSLCINTLLLPLGW